MTTLKIHKTWALLIAALALGAAVLAAFTLGGGASDAAADDPATPAESIRLAALGDAAPEQPVPFLGQDYLTESGYDVESARVLSTAPTGSQVLAIPRTGDGERQFCVVVTEASKPLAGAGACATVGTFNTNGVFVTLTRGNPDTDEVVGVLPDGVASVTVKSDSGTVRTMDVRDSVVRFSHDGASTVAFSGPDGAVERPIAGGLTE